MKWRPRLGQVITLLAMLLITGLVVGLGREWYALPGVEFGQPWLLLCLNVVPVIVYYSFGRLVGLGPIRRWLALALRSAIVIALVMALAEMRTVREDDTLTVLILLDRSYSTQELEVGSDPKTGSQIAQDRRWLELTRAIKKATANRPHARDRVGVIVFGRKPRLEYPASDLPELNVQDLVGAPDRNYTDIAAAIKLGLASFPEGTGRRLLLISDGNENRGNALKEAENARLNRVRIDVVPLNYNHQEEVVVSRIDVPSETPEGRDVPIKIIVRNYSDRPVTGTLLLRRTSGPDEVDMKPQRVTINPGPPNVLELRWPADQGASRSYSYRAVFKPDSLPADRPDNNEAWAHVMVRREGRRVLLVVPDETQRDHEVLRQTLETFLQKKRLADPRNPPVEVWAAGQLPDENSPRFHDLSNFDSVVLYNISADQLPRPKQEALRKNTADQGCGLVVIGGPSAFGAGGWQDEPLEQALPIDTSIRGKKVQAKTGLVLIMHACEMQEGNYWQKEVAKLAVKKLSPEDEVGVLYFDWAHKWHIPLQPIGNRLGILRDIDRMTPGDMPNFDPVLQMALKSLTERPGLASKHTIIISDGDPVLADQTLPQQLKKAGITVTTVRITTHPVQAMDQNLERISKPTGGRHYPVDDPQDLPGIYIKETRLVSQNFLYENEKGIKPAMTSEQADPLREWTRAFPPLYGYVRTTPKASELAQVLLYAPIPADENNPLLAQWQYRLGRVVAFTSDIGGHDKSWARDWALDQEGFYTDFWTRVAEWSMRPAEDSALRLESRYENGQLRVTLIDNRDKPAREAEALADMRVIVSSAQGSASKEVHLDPVSAGVYEASIGAEDAGSYWISVSGTVRDRKGTVLKGPMPLARTGLTVPYSPEFAAVKSNEGLLEQIAHETGGRMIDEKLLADAELFRHDVDPTPSPLPIWYWLLFAVAAMLLADVGVRRIAIEPAAVAAKVRGAWDRLRGRAALSEQSQQYLDRLRSRKAAVGEELARTRAAQRFEAAIPAAAPAKPQAVPPTPPRPAEKPKPVPREQPQEAGDFATRLMRAKQKAREQIEGDKQEPDAGEQV